MAMSRSSNFFITTVPIASRSPIAWLAGQGSTGAPARGRRPACHACGLAQWPACGRAFGFRRQAEDA